ncbi:MAG: hypothetical protein ABSH35_33120 [Isosphaeraceae bacterium]|jgi:hypothetical protein
MSSKRKHPGRKAKPPEQTPEGAIFASMVAEPDGPKGFTMFKQRKGYWLYLCPDCGLFHRREGKAPC